MKNVLIMCTGNSCRSIIAEALINAKLKHIQAYSCGVSPSGFINENVKKILTNKNIWKDSYHSKDLNSLTNINFDLVVTVCDHAKDNCPIFDKKIKTIHIGFEDPSTKPYEIFEETYQLMEKQLLPKISKILDTKQIVTNFSNGVNIAFSSAVKKQNIVKMVQNCQTGQCDCMSQESKEKIKDMKVSGEDGEVALDLIGNISQKEVEDALAKSELIKAL